VPSVLEELRRRTCARVATSNASSIDGCRAAATPPVRTATSDQSTIPAASPSAAESRSAAPTKCSSRRWPRATAPAKTVRPPSTVAGTSRAAEPVDGSRSAPTATSPAARAKRFQASGRSGTGPRGLRSTTAVTEATVARHHRSGIPAIRASTRSTAPEIITSSQGAGRAGACRRDADSETGTRSSRPDSASSTMHTSGCVRRPHRPADAGDEAEQDSRRRHGGTLVPRSHVSHCGRWTMASPCRSRGERQWDPRRLWWRHAWWWSAAATAAARWRVLSTSSPTSCSSSRGTRSCTRPLRCARSSTRHGTSGCSTPTTVS